MEVFLILRLFLQQNDHQVRNPPGDDVGRKKGEGSSTERARNTSRCGAMGGSIVDTERSGEKNDRYSISLT